MHRVSAIADHPAGPRPVGHPARRGAFTLIELLVVMVLLGLVAGLVVPRITTNDRRLAESKVREIASMFSVVAQRNAVANEHLALNWNRTTNDFVLQVLRTKGDDTRWEKPKWANDPLVPPVKVEKVQLSEALFDGGKGDLRKWRLDLAPFQPRPTIELVLRTEPGVSPPTAWLVELLPYAGDATITEIGASGSPRSATNTLRSIDLDAAGQGESPW